MTELVLLVSPHSDDISMSAFGIVSKKRISGEVTLLTVFSQSDYLVFGRGVFASTRVLSLVPKPSELADSVSRNAHAFGANPKSIFRMFLDPNEASKVSRIRLLEDIAFSKKTGMKFRYFDFPSSGIRQGRPIMDPNWPLASEEELLGRITSALQEAVSRLRVNAIAAPWPYGPRQHLDHRLVNVAATRVAEEKGIRLFYLDDQPYSRRPLEIMQDARGHCYTPGLVRLDQSEMRGKLEAMATYRSQMTPDYFRAVSMAPPGSPSESNSETLWEQTSLKGGSG